MFKQVVFHCLNRNLIPRLRTVNIHQTLLCPRLQYAQHRTIYILPIEKYKKERRGKKAIESPAFTDSTESDEQYMVRLKNDPDSFGPPDDKHSKDLLEDALPVDTVMPDEGDGPEVYFRPTNKMTMSKYAIEIKKLIRQRKIKEAIDYLEVKIIKEDRFRPTNYIFNLVIGACGRVGFTQKAFNLYSQMKNRRLKPHASTYTSLFTACTYSPFRENGLKRATQLRESMQANSFVPNSSNYNAMIQAFGRLGDLPTSFNLIDEMVQQKHRVGISTINMLLRACGSDSEVGFRHALLLWQRIAKRKLKPNVYTYHTMLHTIRACGIGDKETVEDAIKQILTSKQKCIASKETNLMITTEDANSENVENAVMNPQYDPVMEPSPPNLMADPPHLGNLLALKEIETASDRLLLVGGWKGFLDNMSRYGIQPNIKTFTHLLECLPDNTQSEKNLMNEMTTLNVKPDITFYNVLMKKRSFRRDFDNARQVSLLIKQERLFPDIITFGVLALGCTTQDEAYDLLHTMRQHKYSLNKEILGAMVFQACYSQNFPYVEALLNLYLEEKIDPSQKTLDLLSKFRNKYKKISNKQSHELVKTKWFMRHFSKFNGQYKDWLTKVKVDTSEDIHPWQQFKEPTMTTVRTYKDPIARFKPRHTSKFRVKTAAKYVEQNRYKTSHV